MKRMLARLGLLLLVLCGAPACAPLYEEVMLARVADAEYEVLYPRHVGICAVTQYRRLDGDVGGSPGHGVMYLKGACLDETAPYPRLRRCKGEATSWEDPEHGVGISVNRWFRNVNWVGTPDPNLFFNGGVGRKEVLDEERVDLTARRAIDTGMFRGVEYHDYPTDEPERSLEDFVRTQSLGTDFALRFGRSLLCSTMPVTESMLDDVIAYLNDLNARYAEGDVDYEWSGYADNCVHTVRNALAAGDVWAPKSVRAIKMRQLFNMAVPANEFVNLGWRGTRFPLESFSRVHADPAMRRALEERDWLPTRHGVLVATAPIHALNTVYDHRMRLLVANNPLTRATSKRGERLLQDARFTTPDLNLYYWHGRYERILEARPDPERLTLRGRAYLDAEGRFYDYIERQLAEVEQLIERYLALDE
jgi:hypothetical protein